MSAAAEIASPCPVCGSTLAYVYMDDQDHNLSSSVIGSSRTQIFPGRIMRCSSCGFAFQNRRSSPRELGELYSDMDTSVYESELEGRDRTAKRHLDIVQRQIRSGALLDVGCASGLFLSHALEVGWKVTGLEPNRKLFEAAKRSLNGNAELHCSTFETAQLKGKFDAITLWDVLEHVPSPVDFLVECRNLLRPGGYLFANVPDIESLQARVLGHRWPLLLPEHLNYFNRPSLRLCGERAGLSLLSFSRRRAFFSLKYISMRLSQHKIIGSKLLLTLGKSRVGRLMIPISLGETLSVWQSKQAAS